MSRSGGGDGVETGACIFERERDRERESERERDRDRDRERERAREREREQIKHELSDSECSGLKVTA